MCILFVFNMLLKVVSHYDRSVMYVSDGFEQMWMGRCELNPVLFGFVDCLTL